MGIPLFFLYFWGQKYKKKTLFYFNCFSVAKSSKSHPTDSDVGVRTSESGVGRLRGFASKPSPPLSLSAFRPLFRHRTKSGITLREKRVPERMPYKYYTAACGGTVIPHSRLTRKKRVRAAARPPRGDA